MIVKYAAKLIKAGKTHEEIITGINNAIEKTKVYAIAGSLDYAVKGGRVSSTKKIIADLLNIKPVMSITKDGKLGPIGAIFGKKNTTKKIYTYLSKQINPNKIYHSAIGHCINEKEAEILRKIIYEKHSNINSISVLEIGCALGAHTGPHTLAIAIQEKLNILCLFIQNY